MKIYQSVRRSCYWSITNTLVYFFLTPRYIRSSPRHIRLPVCHTFAHRSREWSARLASFRYHRSNRHDRSTRSSCRPRGGRPHCLYGGSTIVRRKWSAFYFGLFSVVKAIERKEEEEEEDEKKEERLTLTLEALPRSQERSLTNDGSPIRTTAATGKIRLTQC